MNGKAQVDIYDFGNDYKKLPVKKRAILIQIARNLLKQQKENNVLLYLASVMPSHKEGEKT
jgi:hypothetical protein